MEKLYVLDNGFFDISILGNDTIYIEVSLKNFYGNYEYVYDKINLIRLQSELKNFRLEESEKKYNFHDTDSDSYIDFIKGPLGHLSVVGQIGSKFSGTYLCFKFEADQTIISLFIEKIENFLEK